MKNYYEILEVLVTASQEQIRSAYRKKAIKYHPDKHFGDKYFSDLFLEIKEAYETLSDLNKRSEYDKKYKVYFIDQNEERKKPNTREEDNEGKFSHNPHRSFFSYQDRIVDKTPQLNPKINHWGEKLLDNVIFFKLPKNIGKIISGHTTLTKEVDSRTWKDTILSYVKSIGIALIISVVIIFLFTIRNQYVIIILEFILLAISIWFTHDVNKFEHVNTFVGINGFAEFECKNNIENTTKSFEINFKEITDLLRVTEVVKRNFAYAHTNFGFVWLNNNRIIKEVNGCYFSEEGNPEKTYTSYWLNHFSERYWTIYLLDNMENELETKGYLEFFLYSFSNNQYLKNPYIQLGIGYIKFITDKGIVTYNFNEIKKVYKRGTSLFIEHTNYEKKFLFFENGNKNGIPLMNLSNREFFFRAMDILLGYKFS